MNRIDSTIQVKRPPIDARQALRRLLPQWCTRAIRDARIVRSIEHLHGTRSLALDDNEAVVTCVVKNGEYYLSAFIEHYLKCGFRHIFFLDNGSSDRTPAAAARYAETTVFRSCLPIESNQRLFKAFLGRRCATGGWRLDADIDEFFDYPYSSQISLKALLSYLNVRGFTTVMTQLLDLFAPIPLSAVRVNDSEDQLEAVYTHYDNSALRQVAYFSDDLAVRFASANTLANPSARLFFGGIRKALYGSDCLLTKHSLFRVDPHLELFPHVHFMNRARVADISCVMRHYKLTSSALAVAQLNREAFSGNSSGYDAFIDFLQTSSSKSIAGPSAKRYTGTTRLIDEGFLFCSDEYRRYIDLVQPNLGSSVS
jgi:hypothetical protein